MTQAEYSSNQSNHRWLMASMLCVLCLALSACLPRSSGNQESYDPAAATVQPYSQAARSGASARLPVNPVITTEDEAAPNYEEHRVALLVPLSGRYKRLGQSILDAAMLGLFDKYAGAPERDGEKRVTLMPYDTEGDPKVAARMATKALDAGAELIIGPLFSANVKVVQPIAKKRKVAMISLSNNADIAGDNVFIFGFMPGEQVKRVLAMAQRNGLTCFAAALPANAYGDLVQDALMEHASLYDTKIVGVVRYPKDDSDVTAHLQRLSGSTTSTTPPKIDALLLAEGGESFTNLVGRLSQLRLDRSRVKYLGTGLLDDATLLGNPAVEGTWFASSPLTSYRGFISRFEHAYDYTPPRLASLGYDAVALSATTLDRGGFSAKSLLHPSGFEGPANGIFRFRKDGTIERGLAVMEIDRDGFNQISAAPRMFY